MIQVIFKNGKFGAVRDASLGRVLGRGVVAAYKPFDEWVEIRRRCRTFYEGAERRATVR